MMFFSFLCKHPGTCLHLQMQLLALHYGDMGVAGGTMLPLSLPQPLPRHLAHGMGGFALVSAAGWSHAGGFGVSGSRTLLPAPPQVSW